MRFAPTLAGYVLAVSLSSLASTSAWAEIGDPQIGTNHIWYPGELSCSTFERLFATQAALYEHVVGRRPETDHDKVLAAWLWRNTHYWHGEPGAENLSGEGFTTGLDGTPREYWTGLFAHGFALCGTTHAQWVPELNARLGHNRARTVGTAGHNSFEVFVTGGGYGRGKWVLLDHDLSTVLVNEREELLSIREISRDWKRFTRRDYAPNQKCGWLPCGLHPDDGSVYAEYRVAEYLSGYAGPPPRVALRRGEALRRYFAPGLEDGKTFVYWGRNYNTGEIPGPERAHTWVNQPEAMYRSTNGAGYKPGQARYANAVYTYTPDFASGDYREAAVSEENLDIKRGARQVTLTFQTPYIIAATPAGNAPWDIYRPGCKNGLVITGQGGSRVSLSVDRGQTWHDLGSLNGTLDATDFAKGFRQYWLRVHAPAEELAASNLRIRTVCQMNSSLIPRLPKAAQVRYEASHRGVVSAGPTIPQARAHLVAGKFDSPTVTLQLAPPPSRRATAVYAAAHLRSSSPPDPAVAYSIEFSTDAGRSWQAMVGNWRITRRGDEPDDFWSQSFCWGHRELVDPTLGPVQVRFRNTGGKAIVRTEMHLEYETGPADPCTIAFGVRREKSTGVVNGPVETLEWMAGSQPHALEFEREPEVVWVELRPTIAPESP